MFCESWGNRRLKIGFAFGEVEIVGLSESQKTATSQEYKWQREFVSESVSYKRLRIKVLAHSLDCPVSYSVGELTDANNVYSPIVTSIGGKTLIVGIKSKALISFTPEGMSVLLGVFHEAELAQPVVFENLLRVLTAYAALRMGGVLLHSAGFIVDNKAVIFVGRSGVGTIDLYCFSWVNERATGKLALRQE